MKDLDFPELLEGISRALVEMERGVEDLKNVGCQNYTNQYELLELAREIVEHVNDRICLYCLGDSPLLEIKKQRLQIAENEKPKTEVGLDGYNTV